ncbi:MAG: putative signal transducing protein [Magnetospiraceae bacterium]
MRELIRSNDPVFLSWITHRLADEGIGALVLDTHASIMEGSLGVLPRRVMVAEDDLSRATWILDAGPDPAPEEDTGTTRDTLLDGRVILHQPGVGYRAAIDPVLLAAATPARAGQRILDAGCGVGAAALCLLARESSLQVTGVELQSDLAHLAEVNAAENGVSDCFQVLEGDLLKPPSGRLRAPFDGVLSNPPFLTTEDGNPPQDPVRFTAHVAEGWNIGAWVDACLAVLRPKGTLTLIYRADRLDRLLAALHGTVGELKIIPLWPKAGRPAKRVIVSGRKGIASPTTLHPGLVLHEENGEFTAETTAILKDGGALT